MLQLNTAIMQTKQMEEAEREREERRHSNAWQEKVVEGNTHI